jgi:phage gpG-like protein
MTNNFPLKKIAAHFKQVLDKAPVELGLNAVDFFVGSFKNQGWQGATFQRWPARKVNNWNKRNNTGRSILIQSGRLRRSIRVTSSSTTQVTIGTDVPYARVHNEGYKGPVKQQVKSFTRKNRSNVKSFSRTINQNIPQRKFMGESPILTEQLKRKLETKLLTGLPNSL